MPWIPRWEDARFHYANKTTLKCSYGFAENRPAIALFLQYAKEQGLLWRDVAPEEFCEDESAARWNVRAR